MIVPEDRPQFKAVPLASIRTDAGTQMRAKLCQEQIDHFIGLLGEDPAFELDPVDVFAVAGETILAHGFHRYHAYHAAGRETIPAKFYDGDLRDCILFAASSNVKNGVIRSRADKVRAVSRLLEDPEWSAWSDSEIARRCQVTRRLVSKCREELAARTSEDEPESDPAEDSEIPKDSMTEPHLCARPSEPVGRRFKTKHGTEAVMRTARIGRTAEDRSSQDPAPLRVPLKDGEGKPVPDHLYVVFERLEDFKTVLQLASDLKARCNELAETDAGGMLAGGVLQQLNADLENVKRAVAWARPHSTCPKCNGQRDACPHCRARQWVNKSSWNTMVGGKRAG